MPSRGTIWPECRGASKPSAGHRSREGRRRGVMKGREPRPVPGWEELERAVREVFVGATGLREVIDSLDRPDLSGGVPEVAQASDRSPRLAVSPVLPHPFRERKRQVPHLVREELEHVEHVSRRGPDWLPTPGVGEASPRLDVIALVTNVVHLFEITERCTTRTELSGNPESLFAAFRKYRVNAESGYDLRRLRFARPRPRTSPAPSPIARVRQGLDSI